MNLLLRKAAVKLRTIKVEDVMGRDPNRTSREVQLRLR